MRVLCGHCGKALEVEDSQAGRTVDCPHCAGKVDIPLFDDATVDEAIAAHTATGGDEEGFAAKVREAMAKKLRVVCGSCGRGLTVATGMAGRKAVCPACGERIRIPFPDDQQEARLRDLPEESLQEITAVESDEGDDIRLVARAVAAESETQKKDLVAEVVGVRKRGMFSSVGWLLALAALAAAVGLGIWLAFILWPANDTAAPTKDSWSAPDPGARPDTTEPRTAASTETAGTAAPGRVELRSAEADVFMLDGYRPAAPGNVYWKLRIALWAGKQPVTVKTFGDGMRLTVGTQTVLAMGSLDRARALAFGPQRETVGVAAGGSKEVEVVFEVPAAAGVGQLNVPGIGHCQVGPIEIAAVPEAAAVVGAYAETAPRNLVAVLRDPIMRGIQQSPGQTLRVTGAAGELKLEMPQAGVTGLVQPIGGGLYEVMLQSGQASLACKLRVIDRGQKLILYLSEEPFRQLTFVRK